MLKVSLTSYLMLLLLLLLLLLELHVLPCKIMPGVLFLHLEPRVRACARACVGVCVSNRVNNPVLLEATKLGTPYEAV
jgi:hypothetical protein